ncbi:MAG: sugar ABC transporter substrate-binding protein [Microbacterium sp.]|nr:sugar ABC transporter substrate-binding protein [Microbacterium sp.]
MQKKRLYPLAFMAAAATLLTACTSGGGDATPSGEASGKITVWSTSPTAEHLVDLFEKAHPEIKVTLNKAAEPTQLETAFQAGSGAPDVAMVDYSLVAQYARAGYLAPLDDLGGAAVKDDYIEGLISQISIDDKLYGIPLDAAPMAMMYRSDLLDAAGITPPKTWDEFAEAAKTYRTAHPDGYFVNSALSDQALNVMLWQAGLSPVTTSGEKISVSYDSSEALKVTEYWTDLAGSGAAANLPIGAPEWIQAVAEGKIATLLAPAWFSGVLSNVAPDSAGSWAVAPMPTWEAGTRSSAQKGGSAYTVTEQSKNKLAAATFAIWVNHEPAAADYLFESGGFPTLKSYATDATLLSTPFEFFGGQPVNEVFAEELQAIPTGWQWSPFATETARLVGETEQQIASGASDAKDALKTLQSSVTSYAENQGFTVKK